MDPERMFAMEIVINYPWLVQAKSSISGKVQIISICSVRVHFLFCFNFQQIQWLLRAQWYLCESIVCNFNLHTSLIAMSCKLILQQIAVHTTNKWQYNIGMYVVSVSCIVRHHECTMRKMMPDERGSASQAFKFFESCIHDV